VAGFEELAPQKLDAVERAEAPVRSALDVFRGSALGRMEGATQEVKREFPRLGPRKLKDETPRHARSRRGIAWKFM
jgi:hypothetical protein